MMVDGVVGLIVEAVSLTASANIQIFRKGLPKNYTLSLSISRSPPLTCLGCKESLAEEFHLS